MLTFEWDTFTLSLYLLIIILTYFISFFVFTNKNNLYDLKINYIPLFITFFIFFIFASIRKIGTDYSTYQDIFNSANDKSESSLYGIEPGFLLYNKLIRLFTTNSSVYFTITSFITLLFVFISLIRNRVLIHFPFAILVYSTLYYFQSYSLIRAYLASAILLYSFEFLVNKKYIKFCILFLITSSIHYSTFLILLPLLGLFLYRIKIIYFYLYIILLFVFTYQFSNYLIFFNLTDRYSGYLENIDKSGSIGFGQIFENVPILLLLYIAKIQKNIDSYFLDVITVFTWFIFFFGVLGYWIPTISRVNYILTFPFLLFIPMFIKSNQNTFKNIFYKFFVIVYLSIRLYIYFSALAFSDGINEYNTIFN